MSEKSRYSSIDYCPPGAAFGSCYLCRSATKVFVRTLTDAWEGEVVFCDVCAKEIGKAAGMFSAENRDKYVAEVAELKAENDELRESRRTLFDAAVKDAKEKNEAKDEAPADEESEDAEGESSDTSPSSSK